ncbi:MAG: hypothetical protein JW739_07575 [Opitutales bacterium]|nr:hypothetical protein [Opitutales bacterium]
MKKTLLLALLMFTFILTGCETGSSKQGKEMAVSGEDTFYISIPEEMPANGAFRAVTQALINRGWTVEEKTDAKIVATLAHREYNAKLTFTLEDNQIVIVSDSTKDGMPDVPIRWIRYLEKDIQKFLYVN